MGATPSSPEDIAKALLLQSALARKGVSPKAIADAINKLTRCITIILPNVRFSNTAAWLNNIWVGNASLYFRTTVHLKLLASFVYPQPYH